VRHRAQASHCTHSSCTSLSLSLCFDLLNEPFMEVRVVAMSSAEGSSTPVSTAAEAGKDGRVAEISLSCFFLAAISIFIAVIIWRKSLNLGVFLAFFSCKVEVVCWFDYAKKKKRRKKKTHYLKIYKKMHEINVT
jgi:hypothetical protein